MTRPLDIFWLRDESKEGRRNLAPWALISAEIVEAELAQFSEILVSLEETEHA